MSFSVFSCIDCVEMCWSIICKFCCELDCFTIVLLFRLFVRSLTPGARISGRHCRAARRHLPPSCGTQISHDTEEDRVAAQRADAANNRTFKLL